MILLFHVVVVSPLISFFLGASVYFSGVDMLDDTPVLDLKPYIPSYDNPLYLTKSIISGDVQGDEDQASSDACLNSIEGDIGRLNCSKDFGKREAPDGEESGEQVTPLPVNLSTDTSFPMVSCCIYLFILLPQLSITGLWTLHVHSKLML